VGSRSASSRCSVLPSRGMERASASNAIGARQVPETWSPSARSTPG
jgi:hypothetical protein